MTEKRYVLSAQKVEELKSELKNLETKGREEIADSLDWLRSLPNDQDDSTFSDIFEDQRYLERRIAEIKTILSDYDLVEGNKEGLDEVKLGSKVVVGFDKFEEEYLIVSAIEANPLENKISDESPVGRALIGHRIGDSVTVDVGLISKEYRVLKIK